MWRDHAVRPDGVLSLAFAVAFLRFWKKKQKKKNRAVEIFAGVFGVVFRFLGSWGWTQRRGGSAAVSVCRVRVMMLLSE